MVNAMTALNRIDLARRVDTLRNKIIKHVSLTAKPQRPFRGRLGQRTFKITKGWAQSRPLWQVLGEGNLNP